MLSRIRKAMDEREEGFTLIELLVVMIIIGILAAIAIPVFLNQRKSGYDAGAKSDVKNAATALETYYTDNNKYTSTKTDLANYSTSAHTTGLSITLTDAAGVTAAQSAAVAYKIDGTSESGKHFCYNSNAAGNGVTSNGTAAC